MQQLDYCNPIISPNRTVATGSARIYVQTPGEWSLRSSTCAETKTVRKRNNCSFNIHECMSINTYRIKLINE